MSLSAGEIVRLLKSDRDALRELAIAIVSEPELRLSVINAVVADMATKQDLSQLRQELKADIFQLRQEMRGEMAQLRQELAQLRQEMSQLRQEMSQLRQGVDGGMAQLRQEMSQLRQGVDGGMGQLRQEVRGEIDQMRQEIAQLRRDMNTNFRWTIGLIIVIWGTTVIPLLMRLAGVI